MSRERRGKEIVQQLAFLKVDTRDFVAGLIDSFVDILVSFFRRQTIICIIEGVFYGVGFWLVGLPYGFLVGFALGVMNLVPFFGSLVCLPVALPLAYFAEGGSLLRLLLVLSVWLAGQLLDGYLITPKIQGDRTGLGYAGVVFSFFFWATVLGPLLGMLLAIPLSAFCVVLWRALKARYIKPVV
jgi:predicted PurR-regulated permease PerM